MWATAAAPPRAPASSASSSSAARSSTSATTGDVAFDLLFPRRPGGNRRAASVSASASSSSSSGRLHTLPPAFSKEELWTFSPAESAAMASSSASSTTSSTASSSALDEPSDARSSLAAAAAAASSASHGVIGSSSARLVWNRVAPEEEEREEEALPAYLSYASASAFAFPSDRFSGFSGRPAPASSSSSALTAFPMAFGGESVDSTSTAAVASSAAASTTVGVHVEEKTKELAQALQEFILAQVGTPSPSPQGHAHATDGAAAGSCECAPLRTRVGELESAVKAMQAQMERLLPSADGTDGGSGDQAQGNTVISDRISTLEGRQSAFQSQLAQISRVLGVPVGKHGKNSPLKTLVQSLHDAIDQKMADAEAAATARVLERVEALAETTAAASKTKDALVSQASDVQDNTDEQEEAETADASESSLSSPSSTSLPMEAVLSALAQEHEASMAKLSGALEERMLHESKQRVALEARVHARLAQQEEWLLQLEREVSGTRYEGGASACPCAAEVALLAQRVDEMGAHPAVAASVPSAANDLPAASSSSPPLASTPVSKKKAAKSAASSSPPPVSAPPLSPAACSSASPPSFCSLSEAAALRSSIQQLQTLVRQLQSEHKAEGAALRESVLLGETLAQAAREETRALAKTSAGLKQLVEKLVRDTGAAEELLQQYVSTITHQVASVTRQYVSVRIRDNNRLIDAALRARVPAYAANESERFLLVRPETKAGTLADDSGTATPSTSDEGGSGVVLHEDDADGMRQFVMATMAASSAK